MLKNEYAEISEARGIVKCSLLGLLLAITPGVSSAEIIWSGDYETGDFTQWHLPSDPTHPQFNGIPAYGRPTAPVQNNSSASESYYGNGELMELVTDPVRNGTYANKITIKNSINGSETGDCDNGACFRRRSELNMHLVLGADGATMPYQSERWISASHYLPSDYDSTNGTSWGPEFLTFKSPRTNEISPTLGISLENGGWKIFHRWSPVDNPNSFAEDVLPWQYQMFYAGDESGSPYPSTSNWPDGLVDFPDVDVSHAALQSINKGGWTDWIIHVKWDGRGSSEGGTGFLTLWKREDSGPWIKVLHITPRQTTRGGLTFDHGIGYKVPGSGFGPLAGMYMDKKQVWGLPENRVIYNDNIKIGSNTATFSEMSPDGSSPDLDGALQPKPPVLVAAP